jgi:hypothetical protein
MLLLLGITHRQLASGSQGASEAADGIEWHRGHGRLKLSNSTCTFTSLPCPPCGATAKRCHEREWAAAWVSLNNPPAKREKPSRQLPESQPSSAAARQATFSPPHLRLKLSPIPIPIAMHTWKQTDLTDAKPKDAPFDHCSCVRTSDQI